MYRKGWHPYTLPARSRGVLGLFQAKQRGEQRANIHHFCGYFGVPKKRRRKDRRCCAAGPSTNSRSAGVFQAFASRVIVILF